MPRVAYKDFNFQDKTLRIIAAANEIIGEYMAQGYVIGQAREPQDV